MYVLIELHIISQFDHVLLINRREDSCVCVLFDGGRRYWRGVMGRGATSKSFTLDLTRTFAFAVQMLIAYFLMVSGTVRCRDTVSLYILYTLSILLYTACGTACRR